MTDTIRWRIILLADYGFHCQCIADKVLKYDGQKYSTSYISAIVRKAGIRIRDYRDGINDEAKAVFRRLFKNERPVAKITPQSKRKKAS